MNHKWFWSTFAAWVFLGVTVSAWPLIYSPFRLSQAKISEFKIEANGVQQRHQIWVSSSRMEPYAKAVIEEWEKEGWKSVTGNWELTPYLLGIEANPSLLLNYLRIQVFKKESFFKILSFWNNLKDGQTYCWEAELPAMGLQGNKSLAQFSFPLTPPPSLSSAYWGKVNNLQFACWKFNPHPHLEKQFRDLFSAQGFSGRLWNRRPTEATYLLEKGPARVLAIVKSEPAESVISLLLFFKRGSA